MYIECSNNKGLEDNPGCPSHKWTRLNVPGFQIYFQEGNHKWQQLKRDRPSIMINNNHF